MSSPYEHVPPALLPRLEAILRGCSVTTTVERVYFFFSQSSGGGVPIYEGWMLECYEGKYYNQAQLYFTDWRRATDSTGKAPSRAARLYGYDAAKSQAISDDIWELRNEHDWLVEELAWVKNEVKP